MPYTGTKHTIDDEEEEDDENDKEDDDGDDENLEEGLSGALCPIQGLPLARSSHTAMQST